jgi:hypothetical protein
MRRAAPVGSRVGYRKTDRCRRLRVGFRSDLLDPSAGPCRLHGRPATNSTLNGLAVPVFVVGNYTLIVLEFIPVDIAFVLILQQDAPLLAPDAPSSPLPERYSRTA